MNTLERLNDSATTAVATVAAKATIGGIKAVDSGFSLMGKALDTKVGRKLSDGFGKLMSKKIGRTVFTGIIFAPMMGAYVAADAGNGSGGLDTSMIKTILGYVEDGVKIIGGVVIAVGAVQFGISWKDDDSSGKTRGLQTMVGGAIVEAVGLSRLISGAVGG